MILQASLLGCSTKRRIITTELAQFWLMGVFALCATSTPKMRSNHLTWSVSLCIRYYLQLPLSTWCHSYQHYVKMSATLSNRGIIPRSKLLRPVIYLVGNLQIIPFFCFLRWPQQYLSQGQATQLPMGFRCQQHHVPNARQGFWNWKDRRWKSWWSSTTDRQCLKHQHPW